MIIKKELWSIEFEVTKHNAEIKSGNFGDMKLCESSLFCAVLKDLPANETKTISSSDKFKNVDCTEGNNYIEFVFKTDEDLIFIIKGTYDDKGISWESEVINNSEILSVMSVSYPVVKVENEKINFFIPEESGRVVEDYAQEKESKDFFYPHHGGGGAQMQYFAFYNDNGGIYMGIHDSKAAIKRFDVNTQKGNVELIPHFPAIGASLKKNSFKLLGKARWEYIEKDWYDASLIYAEFVYNNASWLPEKKDNGRVDTPERFKNVPLWIVDYIPNSEKQMEARPMTLGTVSQMYDADYWFEAPIKLKKELGVPIAYHIYNWHEIPFNINYPHFYPARDEFKRGLKHLKDNGIYVLPYINAVSWETKDADEGFEVNFANTGIKGAVIEENGDYYAVEYPQVKKSGEKTRLAPICPGFTPWHDIIGQNVIKMEENLDIDGVYFDEVAAHKPRPCLSTEHNHIPGGGSQWPDNYNIMMKKIRENKPEDNYYFSESNGECYMKGFDGFLTWLWKKGDYVPAFPLIYSGYIQMIGRHTDGLTRDDDDYFRFHIAQELLFGQQLGWIHPNVVYNRERMKFLKNAVDIRYKYSALFNSGKILRPPVVISDVPPVESSGIVMKQIQAGLWQMADSEKKVLFVINVSKESADCKICFENREIELKLKPCEFYVKQIDDER